VLTAAGQCHPSEVSTFFTRLRSATFLMTAMFSEFFEHLLFCNSVKTLYTGGGA
jgi:hypothetical protein